jgi:cytochrome P450
LATDEITGSKVVLRQHDVEALAHNPRLEGIGLTLFDLMAITDGPLRDWYGRLMFTTEGDYHRRTRSLCVPGLHARSVGALRSTAATWPPPPWPQAGTAATSSRPPRWGRG